MAHGGTHLGCLLRPLPIYTHLYPSFPRLRTSALRLTYALQVAAMARVTAPLSNGEEQERQRLIAPVCACMLLPRTCPPPTAARHHSRPRTARATSQRRVTPARPGGTATWLL